jgi:hypothetical protein
LSQIDGKRSYGRKKQVDGSYEGKSCSDQGTGSFWALIAGNISDIQTVIEESAAPCKSMDALSETSAVAIPSNMKPSPSTATWWMKLFILAY